MVRLLLQVSANDRGDDDVSIPQWCDCCLTRERIRLCLNRCFNPTMVRLLRYNPLRSNLSGNKFQSHNGAIAALYSPFTPQVQVVFQSHNGAIAAFS